MRYKGEKHPSTDASFKQFESVEWGYRAMFVLLDTYNQRYGLNTLRGIISRYAPPEENHTAIYIDFVSSLTGIDPDEVIDTRQRKTMIPIVAAMSKMENGQNARLRDVEAGFSLTEF